MSGLVAYGKAAMMEAESWIIYNWIASECNNCEYLHLGKKYPRERKRLMSITEYLQQDTEPLPMVPAMAEGFKAGDIGLRAQKKILSRMSNKSVAKVFIDDTTGSLLDNVYKLAKNYTGNKKEAEKLVKNIIKVVIKIGVLYRNNQFSPEELKYAERFRVRFRTASMTIISFYEVDFSYDRLYMITVLTECRASIRELVQNHLTEKSLNRIDSVFNFFAEPAFLDEIFKKNSEHRELMGRIVCDMNVALDEGGM